MVYLASIIFYPEHEIFRGWKSFIDWHTYDKLKSKCFKSKSCLGYVHVETHEKGLFSKYFIQKMSMRENTLLKSIRSSGSIAASVVCRSRRKQPDNERKLRGKQDFSENCLYTKSMFGSVHANIKSKFIRREKLQNIDYSYNISYTYSFASLSARPLFTYTNQNRKTWRGNGKRERKRRRRSRIFNLIKRWLELFNLFVEKWMEPKIIIYSSYIFVKSFLMK